MPPPRNDTRPPCPMLHRLGLRHLAGGARAGASFLHEVGPTLTMGRARVAGSWRRPATNRVERRVARRSARKEALPARFAHRGTGGFATMSPFLLVAALSLGQADGAQPARVT